MADDKCEHGKRYPLCATCAAEKYPKCEHGNRYPLCATCAAEKYPKCEHGKMYPCGLCLAENRKKPA